jgi:hypothetical protein
MLQQDDLLTQKIELILEMNGKKLLTEIGKLREELSGLKEEVAGLKKATRFGAGAPEPPQQQWPQQAPPQQAAPERRLDKPIDRNGVAPADVSIEKIFYFGNKR